MPKMMRAVQVARANGPFELIEREIPEPGPAQVRIQVEACGICHSDAYVKSGAFPGLKLPRIPGHEIAGRVDKVGANVTEWKKGDRVGVGWHGGHDFVCNACRKGLFINCEKAQVTGMTAVVGHQETHGPSSGLTCGGASVNQGSTGFCLDRGIRSSVTGRQDR